MSKGVSLTKKDKDPTGGLTASGRRKYNRATGGNLQAPVTKKTGLAQTKSKKKIFLCKNVCCKRTIKKRWQANSQSPCFKEVELWVSIN
tara:strand:+ start:2217 stop:2483 length:267 start_codon:yes stop_codon:yes gene_type:complete